MISSNDVYFLLQSVQFDPCLDDCVMFAKKLKKLGNCVKLDILDGLPHGFLNFSMVNNALAKSRLFMTRSSCTPKTITGYFLENLNNPGWPFSLTCPVQDCCCNFYDIIRCKTDINFCCCWFGSKLLQSIKKKKKN